jgi:hypothetical protein
MRFLHDGSLAVARKKHALSPVIRFAPIGELKFYTVSEEELEAPSRGSLGSIYLNIALTLLPLSAAFLVTLLSSTGGARVFRCRLPSELARSLVGLTPPSPRASPWCQNPTSTRFPANFTRCRALPGRTTTSKVRSGWPPRADRGSGSMISRLLLSSQVILVHQP